MKISTEFFKMLGAVLLLAIIIPFSVNLGLFFTDKIAGKNIKFLEILYSNVGNESWVSFWGSFSAGLLTFALIFHYQKQLTVQQLQHKEQLEFQYKHQKQEALFKNISSDKDIIKRVLTNWDTSVFDEIKENINNIYKEKYININKKLPLSKDQIFTFLEKNMKIKNKMISIFNSGMLEIDFLSLRINSANSKNQFYKNKNKVYTDFKKLHDHIEIIFSILDAEIKDIESPYSEVKQTAFLKKFDKKIIEYSNIFNNTINSATDYIYMYEQYVMEYRFDILYDNIFFEVK